MANRPHNIHHFYLHCTTQSVHDYFSSTLNQLSFCSTWNTKLYVPISNDVEPFLTNILGIFHILIKIIEFSRFTTYNRCESGG